jgi:hypothetical protein
MRKNFYSCLILAALFTSTTLCAQDITTGLALHYTFDNVAAGVVPDASGHSLDGTLQGSATTGDGYNGTLAGTFTNVADYLLLPNDITTSLTNFTVASWVNVNSLNTWGRVFDFGSGTTTYMFLCTTNGAAPRFAFKYNDGSEEQINGTTALPLGQWVHLAVTVAYSTETGIGVGTLYVDGVPVGTNTNILITPQSLGSTTQNYIAKSQWSDPTVNGNIDDFRIYSRALSSDDIQTLIGYPVELITQYKALSLGDTLADVKDNLTLPTTLGANGVSVTWTSSNPDVISNTGLVTRPEKFNAGVKLTALLKYTNGTETDSITKSFQCMVTALIQADELIAQWDWQSSNITITDGVTTIKDASGNDFVATLMDVAKVKTIGTTTQYNVVDVGTNKGYVDMGTEIGKAVYALNDYTVMLYYRTSPLYSLDSNGNWLWGFSNTLAAGSDATGYIMYEPKRSYLAITPTNYGAEAGVSLGANSPKGSWHHICYSQSGTTGTLFIDGVEQKTNTVALLPSTTLPIAGRTGTLYNVIGRPCYTGDAYLQNTMLYDFRLYNVSVTGDDLKNTFEVPNVIANLDAAYKEDSDYQSQALVTEKTNLVLTGLSAVTDNFTLPTTGTTDTGIKIAWTSSCPSIISATGVVNRPDFFDFDVTLTATLSKNAQLVTKTFLATVKVKTGTEFTSDLVLNYDFATTNVSDTTVTDAAEKHFTGKAINKARLKTIGADTNKFGVLDLGSNNGYFDMGAEFGKVVYGLEDYTVSSYIIVEESNTTVQNNGNALWGFSNTGDVVTSNDGSIFGSIRNIGIHTTHGYWNTEQMVTLGSPATFAKGKWHHFAVTLKDSIVTVYWDGVSVVTDSKQKWNPKTALKIDNAVGSACNWLGRPPYNGDAYLKQSLVYDFRVYKKALEASEIAGLSTMIDALDAAYLANPNGIKQTPSTDYRLYSADGCINIKNLTNEKVRIYDFTGRSIKVTNPSQIAVKPGLYIVKIDNSAVKVLVR